MVWGWGLAVGAYAVEFRPVIWTYSVFTHYVKCTK